MIFGSREWLINSIGSNDENHYSNGELGFASIAVDMFARSGKSSFTCIDAGLNQGDYSSMILELKPEACIYGVEPIPEFAKKAALRFKGQIYVIRSALSSVTTEVQIGRLNNGARADVRPRQLHMGEIFEVGRYRTKTIDSLANEYGIADLDLLKIDTDGFDYDILLGAQEILKRHSPFVQFEYSLFWKHRDAQLIDAINYMKDLQYSLFYILGNRFISCEFDPSPFPNIIFNMAHQFELCMNIAAVPTDKLSDFLACAASKSIIC